MARNWVRILVVGMGLWLASVLVTVLTANTNLVPTLILLGSFLLPVTFVSWVFETWRDEHVTTEIVVSAFAVGGILGVLGAAVLEAFLLHPSPQLFFGVGLIEEAVKLAALLVVTRHMTRRHMRDGIVLGATVGLGFAAFETAGYAFNALLTMRGLSLDNLVKTELFRSVLAPIGHGLWTGILGGVLFDERRHGRAWRVCLAYLWVSFLHALWDSAHMIAVVLTLLLTGTPWQYELLAQGYLPLPTAEQVRLMTSLSIGGLALVAALGILTMARCWRAAIQREAELSGALAPER
jgi:RsiW-degrading membrane proteinase PrsW (M82 family)